MSFFRKTKKIFGTLKRKLLPENFPSFSKWKQIFRILTKKEKIVLAVFLILFFGSSLFLVLNFYFKNTEIEPVSGGNYKEGLLGCPRFINPIYGENSDVDRDLIQLIFSGLMKYNQKGEIVPDLAKEYKILEDGKVFEFYLKDNLFWQDNEKLTADDVIFTIRTIQNPDYKSPLRVSWVGVEVEKISDSIIRFELKNPYPAFLENLTLKILPSHIWQNISPQNFPLSIYNLKPVGSGPYQLKSLNQDKAGYIKSLTLNVNPKYFGEKPNIREISFQFFEGTEEELIRAAQKKEIDGFSIFDPENYQQFLGNKSSNFEDYHFSLPRYFAVFFNPGKSEILAEKAVREALNYGTNKEEIVRRALLGEGKIVDSPILPEIYGFNSPSSGYEFNPEKAKEILEKAGFVEKEDGIREKVVKEEAIFQFKSELKAGSRGKEVEELQKCLSKYPDLYPEGEITGFFGSQTKEAVIRFQEKYSEEILEPWGFTEGTGIVSKTTRSKLNELCQKAPGKNLELSLSLITANQPLLVDTARLLKEQWKTLGVKVEIETFDLQNPTLESDIIKPRNYSALLFGEALRAIPDPFPFWHSLQKKDPGLNLSSYENKKADKLLEEARQSQESEVRARKLEEFQDILINDAPAVFLYRPDYIYFVSKKIKGIRPEMIANPSERFSEIENWYIKTKRVWK